MTCTVRQKIVALSVPITVESAALLRSVILAWMIGPDELGRAMMLALILRLVEMTSDLGVERLLVQAPEGATPRLQAALHGVLLIRGLGLAAVLLCLAAVFPVAFPDGPTAGTYALLACVPLIRGVLHLDYRRAERRFAYGRLAQIEGGAAMLMLLALGTGLALGLMDHRVFVVSALVQAMAQVCLSHMLSERIWRVSFAQSGLRRVFRFGAPLALNGVLMFLTLQADRMIVAAGWGWSDLALYGVAAQLALLPALIFGRVAQSVLLPQLVAAGSNAPRVLARALRESCLLGGAYAVLFCIMAPTAIAFVYGPHFVPSLGLAAALAVGAGLRIARTPLSVHAVATGRTADTMRANLWRAFALMPALLCATVATPLAAFAATGALGECAALIAGWRLSQTTYSKGAIA